MRYAEERARICEFARSMYDRWLTNAAGGNISCRVGADRFLMTATGLSSHRLWRIDPEDILLVDHELSILEGRGRTTREINMHLAMYDADPELKAVFHAHPRDLMVHACRGQGMPVVCEALRFLGDTVPCLDYHPATTVELAKAVGHWTAGFGQGFRDRVTAAEDIYAYGLLLNRHGVIVGAESLVAGYEMLERLDTNAYVVNHWDQAPVAPRGIASTDEREPADARP